MSGYIYTTDSTPFSTAERTVDGKSVYRNPDTGKVRRYIKRHKNDTGRWLRVVAGPSL